MIRSVHIFIFHLNLPNLLRNTFYLETNNKIPDTYLDEFEIGEFLWWITTKYLIQGFCFKDILIFGVLASNRVAAKYILQRSVVDFSEGIFEGFFLWHRAGGGGFPCVTSQVEKSFKL